MKIFTCNFDCMIKKNLFLKKILYFIKINIRFCYRFNVMNIDKVASWLIPNTTSDFQ